jgi:hypothetical protein
MPNLDIYLQDNGLLEYSRDLALTQYSTTHTIRLLSKKLYYIVNMNVTTGNGIDTYRKSLIINTKKNVDGYYEYSYTLGQDITGYEFSGDKSTVKIAFYLYPDENNLHNVTTTSIVYLPLLKSLEDKPSDGSVTNSELSLILSEINQLKGKLADLGYGETESAKDYNTETGTIKNKFDELEAGIQNLNLALEVVESTLGNVSDGTTTSIVDAIDEFRNIQANVEANLDSLQSTISNLDDRLAEAEELSATIDEIKTVLNTGLSYRVVPSLPTSDRLQGVVYLVPDNNDLESNVYTEYMWLNGAWEKLGSSKSEIDLTNYATKAYVENNLVEQHSTISQETNNKLAIRDSKISDLESDVASINTTLSGKADKATTLVGYGITNAYTKAEVDNLVSSQIEESSTALSGRINTLQRDIDERVSGNEQELNELDTRVSTNESLAQEAKEIALSKTFSKIFDTKAEMLEWASTAPTSNEAIQPGTDIYIKTVDSPDYWVAAVFDTPQQYTNAKGEEFITTYYALEEIEVNLGNYYDKGEIDNKEDAIQGQINSVNDAIDEINNNKTQVIRDTISPDGSLKYPSETAVKTYVDGKIEDLAQEFVDTYETTAHANQQYQALQDAITAESERAKTAEQGLSTDIEAVAGDLATEISRAQGIENGLRTDLDTEVATRASEDSRVLNEANTHADNLDTAIRTELSSGDFVPYQAEGVKDFINNDRIRFTTDSANKDFEITAKNITDIQAVLSWLEPNQYN